MMVVVKPSQNDDIQKGRLTLDDQHEYAVSKLTAAVHIQPWSQQSSQQSASSNTKTSTCTAKRFPAST